ncbi:hypothetical protein [Mucilaginibacter aquatilis]|uniref:Uncharacterized protein n=1 Tax=Mucilaginibacter aquatilis TaxID=1517760 RepID=A0A6I4IRI6_9SPHI|nr:hypothetical protein [Mucilaginibacter aquatilis]MVN92934.1 hypothetical protein [Mucilaginibacter aquatilis]
MDEFYIDIQLNRGLTRIQVDEVPSHQWDFPFIPQFIVEFYHQNEFITLTLQLEHGTWYDRNLRIAEDEEIKQHLDAVDNCTPNYQCALSASELQEIGAAISRHMVVYLTAYLGLLVPAFRNPTLN